METFHTEGVVTQTIPFKDYDQIVTIFTPDFGLIKLMVKGAFRNRTRVKRAATPLTRVDFVFFEGRGDLKICQEISTVQHYTSLRNQFALLEAGCDLLKAIQQSQLEGRSAPALYQLLCFYLEKLPSVNDPAVLVNSFRLKILKYEGLLGFPFFCAICHCPAVLICLSEGGSYCPQHCPSSQRLLTSEEMILIERLTESQSFSQIAHTEISSELSHIITHFFIDSL